MEAGWTMNKLTRVVYSGGTREQHLKIEARKILELIREPTSMMKLFGNRAINAKPDGIESECCYQFMIDAALKE